MAIAYPVEQLTYDMESVSIKFVDGQRVWNESENMLVARDTPFAIWGVMEDMFTLIHIPSQECVNCDYYVTSEQAAKEWIANLITLAHAGHDVTCTNVLVEALP